MLKNRYKKKYNEFLKILIEIIQNDEKNDYEKYIAIYNIILVENIKNILER